MFTLPNYDVISVLCEDATTRTYRGADRQRQVSVLLKTFIDSCPSSELLAGLRREHALLGTLAGNNFARPAPLVEHGQTLVMVHDDIGGCALTELIEVAPCPPDTFFRIALGLVDALECLHAKRIIHLDIKPQSILYNEHSGRIQLRDLGLASRLSREYSQFVLPERGDASLAYLSPEQTGLMNRSVDYRADYYALGMLLHQLLTGELPFADGDALHWVHCHVARTPRSPRLLVPSLPMALANLVLKLLAKLPEDRYQSAAGLRTDLMRCQLQKPGEHHDAFELGALDVSDRLQRPEKLYGREREVKALRDSFERVVASGRPEVVLVSGYSGIGKSALVAELYPAVAAGGGYYLSSKCDQYTRDIPCGAVAQAFQGLVQQLLAESDAGVARWRQRILAAVGDHGRLLVDLIPQLALIIGAQAELADLPPEQSRQRLYRAFQRFVEAFSSADKPLVLFLDDLQWADSASLSLLKQLALSDSGHHLLLIGAYRSNEVHTGHPLAMLRDELGRHAIALQQVELQPLACKHVQLALADLLHAGPLQVAALADLVHAKTRGNPFFVFQFVVALHQDGLLAFDAAELVWEWNLDDIRARDFTDNVVDLMSGEVRRLPARTRQVLPLAGMLGSSFDVATLARLVGADREATQADLWPAQEAGLLIQTDAGLRFLHDRVQEAAYALLSDDERADAHLAIGRLLLAAAAEAGVESHLFEIVSHFARAGDRLVDGAERRALAELGLRSGLKARSAASYVAAADYCAAAIALLPADQWDSEHELAMTLHLASADCEDRAGRLDRASQRIDTIYAHARTVLDRAQACLIRIRVGVTRADYANARGSALLSLRELGVEVPDQPTVADVEEAYAEIDRLMAGRNIEALIELPVVTDPERQMAIRLMMAITTATYFSDPLVWALHTPQMALLNLRHGNTAASPMLYTYFAFELAAGRHRYADAYRYCNMAYALMERLGERADQGNLLLHRAFVAFWVESVDRTLELLRESVPALVERGDLPGAATGANHIVTESLIRALPLADVQVDCERWIALSERSQYEVMSQCMRGRRQLIRMLRGLTLAPGSFDDAGFDTAVFEAKLQRDAVSMPICYYQLSRLIGHVVLGETEAAQAAAERAKNLLWAATGTSNEFIHALYAGLAAAASHDSAPQRQRAGLRRCVAGHEQRLAALADVNPATFTAAHALIAAEHERIHERPLQALGLYERAIQRATIDRNPAQRALAAERAAALYRQLGLQQAAAEHLRTAYAAYRSWGADEKLRRLERAFPELIDAAAPSLDSRLASDPIGGLDQLAISKAALAISGQIQREPLLHTLLTVMLEQAGAQFGALLLGNGEKLELAATIDVVDDAVRVLIHGSGLEPAVELPESVLAYVRHSEQRLLIDDTRQSHPHAGDPVLAARRPASLLCLPILRQGRLTGALYLEHRSVPRAFSRRRLDVLEQLAAQAAISLENAQLYTQLEDHHRRYQALYDQNPSIYFTLDSDGCVLSVNSFGAAQLGYEVDDLIGCDYSDLYVDADRDAGLRFLENAMASGELQRWELRKQTRDGNVLWMRESVRLTETENGDCILLVVAEDTTEAWKLSAELHHQATHDELSGLANRREFERRLAVAIDELQRVPALHALCYFDLDQFKVVNDSCGHVAGDELLRQLAGRLPNMFRRQDVIARIGGDEFAVLMEHVSVEEAARMARRLLDDLRTFRFVWDGKHFPIGASIGLIMIDPTSGSQQTIMSAADAACYLAKESGGNRVHLYNEAEYATAQRFGQLLWVPRINEALAEDRFFLVFQTISALQPGGEGGCHFEVLLRLRERDGRVVSPGEFLPAAERYQLSGTLDYWVVSHTLEWLGEQPERLARIELCSINLSGRSIGDSEFQQRLHALLAATSVPMHKLCFEITETAAITNMDQGRVFIEGLRARGCKFALDDFGSGLASFFYLKSLPMDFVKIDGLFVKDMLRNSFDLALVRSISEVARAGGMHTIAEFAETRPIIERLREIGVDYAQGYGISRPRPLDEF